MRKVKPTRVDLLLETFEGELYLFDLKTAKPNTGGFREFKRTLLEWVAATLSSNPSVKISTAIAIPYNPYEPKPYERWTLQGLFDLRQEVLVGPEFWDLLGGKNTYEDLLKVFEQAGLELYGEIDKKMKNLNNK
jgi:type II restriction enzyme